MASKIQNIIAAALNEQVLECYDGVSSYMAERLAEQLTPISKKVGQSILEDYETRRSGEANRKDKDESPSTWLKRQKDKIASKLKLKKESYDGQTPEVKRGIDFVVEHVAKYGVKAFGPSVERAEEQFGIYNEDLRNFFTNEIREQLQKAR